VQDLGYHCVYGINVLAESVEDATRRGRVKEAHGGGENVVYESTVEFTPHLDVADKQAGGADHVQHTCNKTSHYHMDVSSQIPLKALGCPFVKKNCWSSSELLGPFLDKQ